VRVIGHDPVLFGADPTEQIVAMESTQATAPATEDWGLSAGSLPAIRLL
jgi:hypothetical protein